MATKAADTTTPYEKEMRRAMNAMEAIAGDTDAPINQRLDALQRCVDYWQALILEVAPYRRGAIEAKYQVAMHPDGYPVEEMGS